MIKRAGIVRDRIKSIRLGSSGFTLIELLVVIAIIGILASIILASLNTARAKGRDARRISDIKQIQLALELYYDANGSFPVSIYDTNGSGGTPSPLVTGGYISNMPFDPSVAAACTADGGAGCYTYVALNASGGACATATSYHLGSSLETSNSALSQDADACSGTSGNAGTLCATGTGLHDTSICTTNGASSDFSGLSASNCNNTAGTPYPGTESCYDVTP